MAVALEYPSGSDTPVVTASGAGAIAQTIVDIALEHEIPVHEDGVLTKLLAQSKVGEFIDPQTSRVVAELVCFLYKADEEWKALRKVS